MKLSEFKSSDNISLHHKDNVPCGSVVKGCKELKVKKGKNIPEIFVKTLALHNPELIDIPRKDSIPQLTKSQQKKYNLPIAEIVKKRKAKEPKTEKEVLDKIDPKWNMENLTQKVAKLGKKKFKEWSEKEFGEDKIDKRKSAQNIVVDILNMQGEGKL